MSQRHRIAFALMIVGVAIYGIFHIWKSGWVVWLYLIDLINMPDYRNFGMTVAISAFICLPIPVIGAPICLALLSRSRILRSMMIGFAAFAGLSLLTAWVTFEGFQHAQILLLSISPLFTLAGLLLIKQAPRPDIL